jgi:hypothetical protein
MLISEIKMSTDKKLTIAPQSVDEPDLNLRLEFKVISASSEPFRILIHTANSRKIRELRFDEAGFVAGFGTYFDEPTPQRRLKIVKR